MSGGDVAGRVRRMEKLRRYTRERDEKTGGEVLCRWRTSRFLVLKQ